MSFKRRSHALSWILLPLFLILGFFYPAAGLAAVVCMIAPVAVAFFRGRLWCGHFCPRGSFLDKFLSGIKPLFHLPHAFKNKIVRYSFLFILMGTFALQIFLSEKSAHAAGTIFIRMIFITTAVSIILGFLFGRRTWCMICPMGTMAHAAALAFAVKKNIPSPVFQSSCSSCAVCTKHCPLKIKIHTYQHEGKIHSSDCSQLQYLRY